MRSGETSAAEYDRARAQLPDDVEAFVAEVERYLEPMTATCVGAQLQYLPNAALRLIAIVREQGAENARLRSDVECMSAQIRAFGFEIASLREELERYLSDATTLLARANAAETERDAVRVRLAKLEKAALTAFDHLEGCTLSNPNGAGTAALLLGEFRELLNEKGGA